MDTPWGVAIVVIDQQNPIEKTSRNSSHLLDGLLKHHGEPNLKMAIRYPRVTRRWSNTTGSHNSCITLQIHDSTENTKKGYMIDVREAFWNDHFQFANFQTKPRITILNAGGNVTCHLSPIFNFKAPVTISNFHPSKNGQNMAKHHLQNNNLPILRLKFSKPKPRKKKTLSASLQVAQLNGAIGGAKRNAGCLETEPSCICHPSCNGMRCVNC